MNPSRAVGSRRLSAQDWFVWVDPPLSGMANMAIDRTLLERAERLERPITWVRLYRWEQPTVSIGRHQSPSDAADSEQCRRLSVPIVRRPTGGRAVLHDRELTFAVISNDARRFPLSSIGGTYQLIASILQRGLADLGIETRLSTRQSHTRPSPTVQAIRGPNTPPCFASAARYELLCGDKKLVGSAQRHLHRSFLQHGSMPISIDFEFMGRALGSPAEALSRTVTSLSGATRRPLSFPTLASCLQASFRHFLEAPGRLGRSG